MRYKKTVSVSDLALYCADRDRLSKWPRKPRDQSIAMSRGNSPLRFASQPLIKMTNDSFDLK
jgi:hypothetical protein